MFESLFPEDLQLYEKETPTQVLFFEYCEMLKNTFFAEHLGTTASLKLWYRYNAVFDFFKERLFPLSTSDGGLCHAPKQLMFGVLYDRSL